MKFVKNSLVRLKSQEQFDLQFEKIEEGHENWPVYCYSTGRHTAWPSRIKYLLGTVVKIELFEERAKTVYKMKLPQSGIPMTIRDDMIDYWVTKEEHPEYFL